MATINNTITNWELSPKVRKSNKFGFDDFKTESDLCDYIDKYPDLFCRDILEEDYISHEREWNLNQLKVYGPRQRQVDFMFKTRQSECVLVECKNPTNSYAELRNGIAQLMNYRITAIDNGIEPDRFLLITSEYHQSVARMIEEYNLPFELYILGRNKMLKLLGLTN